MLDPRTFVSLWVILCPDGDDERDGSLARTPRAEVACEALQVGLADRGLRARVDASEPGAAPEDAFVRVQVAGRLHLDVMVGEGSALITARGIQDRHLDLEAEIAQVRAAPGWRRGMPDGPPPRTSRQILDGILAAPPEPAGKHPAVLTRLPREVEEDLPWLRLTGVDGVRVSREAPSSVLTVWVEDRQTLWACLARDATSTADRLHTHEEALRVVRAVVDDALVPWRGRLTRRSRGWRGTDAQGRLQLHAALRPVEPQPGTLQPPA